MASPIQWIRKLSHSYDLPRVFKQLWVIKDVKGGKLAGTDQLGNKYYEDVNETWARQRHVEFSAYDYDATQIPPHWRQWMSHTYQDAPVEKADSTAQYKWVTIKHVDNVTGTDKAYKPYSTTTPKLYSWEPKVHSRE